MDAELAARLRQWAFRLHVALFVGGAVAGALGVGGTWRAGVAAAGACWVGAGLLAFVARRSAFVPATLRAIESSARDDARRADVERAGSIMSGIVLLLVGGTTTALGWAWLIHG
ncbi:MAG: hypothetical protein ACOCV4_09510 [Myxococcota bacterium]